jgi:hypothetical protein
VHLEVDQMAEVGVLHGSSRPEEPHRETAGQVAGHMATVDQEVGRMETVDQVVGHTVAAEHRIGCEEVDRTVLVAEAGEAVVRKVKEAVQGHHTVKEVVRVHRRAKEQPVQAVHRRVTEPVQVVHRAKETVQGVRMAMGRWREVAGKAIDWAEEDQKEELAEKVPLLLRSRSRKHLSCQSGQRLACRPWPSHPWASHPWAYRRR